MQGSHGGWTQGKVCLRLGRLFPLDTYRSRGNEAGEYVCLQLPILNDIYSVLERSGLVRLWPGKKPRSVPALFS